MKGSRGLGYPNTNTTSTTNIGTAHTTSTSSTTQYGSTSSSSINHFGYNTGPNTNNNTNSATNSLNNISGSITQKIAKWTKKVSSFSCAGTLDSPIVQDFTIVDQDQQSPHLHHQQQQPNQHATDQTSMGKVEKPPRTSSYQRSGTNTSSNNTMNTSTMLSSQKKSMSSTGHDDYDHHTLATATTASATISYSTDQGDDASEMGMEVIMSSSSGDHHHHHHHHHHPHNHKIGMTSVVTVEPYASHTFVAGKHTFTVDRRYSMIRTIGSGAYGVVISALDMKKNQNVAIKMVPKAFSDEIDAKRILREIKLLKHFRHENIVSLIDMMPPNVQYLEDFTDVYLVTDLMETDLHRIIYSKQKLSIDHAQYFIYQVLRGLKYIHSCRVLHRDLKPSNLLVNSNCDLKICDFGLARGINRDPNDPINSGSSSTSTTMNADPLLLTEYVVTRWYRAPEIMLACHEYSYPIDVWSVGCIFAELILRKPYFPGDDYIDQLTIITDKLGKLPETDLSFVTSEKAKRFMMKLPNKTPIHLTLQFPDTPLDALDVMRKMIEIRPDKRITVQQALEHPFFESLHNPIDEPTSDTPFDFSFEYKYDKLIRIKLQQLIWEEIGHYRPLALPVAPQRTATAAAVSTQHQSDDLLYSNTNNKKLIQRK